MDRRKDTMENKSRLKALHIGEKTAQIPIIQGGMGVGISRSSLAGAVAREGGIGILQAAEVLSVSISWWP